MSVSTDRAWRVAAAAVLAAGAAGGAAAHPHALVETGVDFLFDDRARLASLRVSWDYDPDFSTRLIADLGLDPDADGRLTEAELVALARDRSSWIEGFEGHGYLWAGGARVGLSRPVDPRAEHRDGRIVVVFERRLDRALPAAGLEAEVKVYDPTFWYEYRVSEPPPLEGAPAGCAAELEPFEPSRADAMALRVLWAMSLEAVPEDPEIGARFADTIRLRCAAEDDAAGPGALNAADAEASSG